MLSDVQPRFCLEGWTKSKFFCTKTAWFNPRAEQINAIQACRRRDIVTKYLVAVNGAWGRALAAGQFLWFSSKKIAILTPKITFRPFWSQMNNSIAKILK